MDSTKPKKVVVATTTPPTIGSSPLLRRIAAALDETSPERPTLRISIEVDAKWEKDGEDEILIRYLCWSINDGDIEVRGPEFEIVGDDVTRERLERELPLVFPTVGILVDHDIELDD